MTVAWDRVGRDDVLRAIQEYDQLGPKRFYSEHGFAPYRILPLHCFPS
jgi:hypothetical protein